ncbi:MAG: VWA domain-containing protein [Vicinamibacterales bacterium]
MTDRKGACLIAILGLYLAAHAAVPANARQPPPQVPGAFRSRITIVPVDIRVLDRNGRPVTDLKQEDFTITEDGVQQEIRHFSRQALTPAEPEPGIGPSFRRAVADIMSPQNHRIFLLVLGRGRLQEPSRGLTALLTFVRERLLPQDQVAVLAYNRATDFTTDHEKVATVIERFAHGHGAIDAKLVHHFSGLAGVYGSKAIPEPIQKMVDDVFRDPEVPGVRKLPPGQIADPARLAADARRAAEALERAELMRDRTGDFAGIPDLGAEGEAELLGMPFEEYVEKNLHSMLDLSSIYGGIDYMRYLEGEKHLVFLSERGLFLPRLENDYSLAAAANDARVVIDTIQTGGIGGEFRPMPPLRMDGRSTMGQPPPPMRLVDREPVQSLKNISALTGGQATAFRYADVGVNRVDQATRFQYLLGYAPSNTEWNGRYRRITVNVNRAGVTVLYRHGYYGREQLVPFDRKRFLTYSRIASAGNYTDGIGDIEVALKPPVVDATAHAVVDLTISASRIAFTRDNDRHVGSLEVAFFCGDAKENLVCELWQTVDLKLKDESYQKFLKEGASYTVRIPLTGPLAYVKVVVYDYAADLVGTAVAKLK